VLVEIAVAGVNFFHWALGEWSSERFVVELRFGLGMALFGCLRAPLRLRMRRDLRTMTGELSRLQAQEPDAACYMEGVEKETWPIAHPSKIL